MGFVRQGNEFLVNTVTASSQREPAITSLANGGFVVSWMDYSQTGSDASGYGIKAQLFDGSGGAVGAEFLVNTATASDQQEPTITGLTNGGFVVSWMDYSQTGGDTSGYGIKAQIYGANGAPVGGEFLVNSVTANDQYLPTITGLSNGGFVVSWMGYSQTGGDASGYGVKAQIYGANGAPVGGEFLVNTVTANDQYYPTITGLSNGGFVVSWMDLSQIGGDASGYGVKAQIYNASGGAVGGEFLVNTMTASIQIFPTIAGLANGGFVVSWMDYSQTGGDTSDFGIKAQIYGTNGAPVGGEFLVNTVTTNGQYYPTITGLTNGGFVVSWMDYSQTGDDTSEWGVKAQVYNASGGAIGGEFLVNSVTASYQMYPTITGLSNGGFVVSWTDYSQTGGDTSSWGIKAQIYTPTGETITGTNGNDTLVGTAYDDTINPLLGRDTVTGGGGIDTLTIDYSTVTDFTTRAYSSVRIGPNGLDGIIAGDHANSVNFATIENLIVQLGAGDNVVTFDTTQAAPTGTIDIDGGAGSDFIEFDLAANATFVDDGTNVAGYGRFANFEYKYVSLSGGVNSVTLAGSSNDIGSTTGVDHIVGGAGRDNWEADFSYLSTPLTIDIVGTSASVSNGSSAVNVEDYQLAGSTGATRVTTDGQSSLNFVGLSSADTLIIDGSGSAGTTPISEIEDGDLNGMAGTVGSTGFFGIESLAIIGSDGNDRYRVFAHSFADATLSIDGDLGDDTVRVIGDRAGYSITAEGIGYRLTDIDADDGETVSFRIEHVEHLQFDDQILALTGGVTLTGTAANDTLTGTAFDDTLIGLGGNDTLLAGAGNDLLNGGEGNDVLNGGDGIDTATYADATHAVIVDLALTAAQGTLVGRDTLISIENLTGSSFADTLKGNDVANLLDGGVGNDKLSGLGGSDTLIGGDGNDALDGGTGADALTGGKGNDTYVVDNAADTVTESANEGTDLVKASVTFTLGADVEKLTQTALGNIDATGNALANVIVGNAGDNVLRGLGSNDNLNGGLGNDTLDGGTGNDTLSGGDGNDLLAGGAGRDVLTGAAGADRFVFDTLTVSADKDTIKDFVAGTDSLALAASTFAALIGDGSGHLLASQFVIGKHALTADQHIVYDGATGALYYDADGFGGGAQVQIASLIGHPALGAADLYLF